MAPNGDKQNFDVGDPYTTQGTYDPVSGDVVIGYTANNADAGIAWGDPSGQMDFYDIPIDFDARDIAVAVDASGEHILIAVLGDNDVAFGVARR